MCGCQEQYLFMLANKMSALFIYKTLLPNEMADILLSTDYNKSKSQCLHGIGEFIASAVE
jgi:hypothetical protein